MERIITASTTMKVNELGCEFNLTHALVSRKDSDGKEVAQALPPHGRTIAYPVDEFPACDDTWVHGSAKASSYFLAVEKGKGAWLDFNACRHDKYDVAVVISVQGVNSVTGQKTKVMNLEQYKTKCPLHDVEFQQDRFCPECKYKWPAQNYMATTGTPNGLFWLDGFRSGDGVIRQYIISDEEMKGVAYNKLDKDKPKDQHERVFAIGVAFYRSKQPKPAPVVNNITRGYAGNIHYSSDDIKFKASGLCAGGGGASACFDDSDSLETSPLIGSSGDQHVNSTWMKSKGFEKKLGSYKGLTKSVVTPEYSLPKAVSSTFSLNVKEKETKTSGIVLPDMSGPPLMACEDDTITAHSLPVTEKQLETFVTRKTSEKIEAKKFEVGAGARIQQDVFADPKDLDYWENEPAGFIYINYTSNETVNQILKAGRRDEQDEGFLSDVPVGH